MLDLLSVENTFSKQDNQRDGEQIKPSIKQFYRQLRDIIRLSAMFYLFDMFSLNSRILLLLKDKQTFSLLLGIGSCYN